MSGWHKVKVPWGLEIVSTIFFSKKQYAYIKEQNIHSRCKFREWEDDDGESWIIAKFKDETDAMAFKLRWM